VNGPAHQRIEITHSFASPLQVCLIEPPPTIMSVLTISYDRFTITAKGDHFMYTLPIDKEVKMQVAYVDSEGNPAAVDGPVVWASSDDDIAQVERDSSNPLVCTVIPVATVGQVQITATADADLGSGTRELITVCDISVVAGEAVAGTITPVGEPTPKP
jgi:hypothetical protein